MGDLSDLTWQRIAPTSPGGVVSPKEMWRNCATSGGTLCEFLQAAAIERETVQILINDSHRSTQTVPALRALASLVMRMSAAPRFDALIATGTHQFSKAQRHEFEWDTFSSCALLIDAVHWHDAREDAELVELADVRFNRHVAQSKYLLPIGSVEPHYFAGLTGPHKTVTIGCMSRNDIERNHAQAMHPDSGPLRLAGNPVHEGVVEIVDGLKSAGKRICSIAEVVCGDRLLALATGDPVDVLHTLLPVVREVYVRTITRPVDVLHLKVPMPLGRNLYQADKALKNNHGAVRDGGGIILEADCPEGVGPDAFLDLLREAGDYATALRVVRDRGYRLGDHKAVKLRHLTDPRQRGVHVALVSPQLAEFGDMVAGLYTFADAREALAWLGEVMAPPTAQGLVIEDAGLACVSVEGLFQM